MCAACGVHRGVGDGGRPPRRYASTLLDGWIERNAAKKKRQRLFVEG